MLTIDDTHRDIVLAVSKPQSEGYNPDTSRLVDFMGSYPPGDMALGELRGPMAEETDSWLNRVALGLPTASGHGGGSASQPDVDESARSVGQAQAAGETSARSRRSARCRLTLFVIAVEFLRVPPARPAVLPPALPAASLLPAAATEQEPLRIVRKIGDRADRQWSICRVAVAVILLTPIVMPSVRLSRFSIRCVPKRSLPWHCSSYPWHLFTIGIDAVRNCVQARR